MVINPTIVFKRPREVVIEDRDLPIPGEDQLLIKTICTMISTGTELTVLEGDNIAEESAWDKYGKFPFTPGYNNIGIVVDAGVGADSSWIGKKVATYGIHAQYIVSDVKDTRVIHKEVSDESAIFFTFAEIVMNSVRRASIRWGDAVAVFGLGLLGQMAVRILKFSGAKPIIGLDVSADRISRLPEKTGIIAINTNTENAVRIVNEITRGRKADIVYEATGNAELIPKEFAVLKEHGKLVILSSPRGKTLIDFHDLCVWPSNTIIGTHNYSHPEHETLDNPWTMKRDFELFIDLIADGDIEVKDLISHRIHFSEAIKIYEMILHDRSKFMGIVMNWI